MSLHTHLRSMILLAIVGSGIGLWGQAPLRKPDAPNPAIAQPKNARPATLRPTPSREHRESVRGNARMAKSSAGNSPLATSACAGAVTASSPRTDPALFPAGGGTSTLNVFVPSACQWKVSTTPGIAPKSGTASTVYSGQQTIQFAVAPNSGKFQTGTISITDAATGSLLAAHMVAQLAFVAPRANGIVLESAAPRPFCTAPQQTSQGAVMIDTTTSPATISRTEAAQSTSAQFAAGFSGETPANTVCSWTVASISDRWLSGPPVMQHVSTDINTGILAVPYTVQANQGTSQSPSSSRTATIVLVPPGVLPGDTLTGPDVTYLALQVDQNGGAVSCSSYSLSPPTVNVPSGGSPETISIGAGGPGASCPWQLTASGDSNANWITGVQGQSGSGDQGSFSFNVTPNTGTSSRTATISIQNQPAAGQITVTQTGVVCTPQVGPTNQSYGANGGSSFFQLSLPSSCQWTATSSNTNWLHVTSGAQGTGPGVVYFTADPNSGTSTLSATISILNAPVFTVTEAPASCAYTLGSTSLPIGSNGGPGSFQVTTKPSSGCSWTALSQQNWISTSSSGQGSGTVNFTIAPNTNSNTRPGTISVADQTFTVTQAGLSCNYTLSLPTINADAGGGAYPVQVTTASGCQWTAQSNANWLSLDTTSGSATATINVSAAANNSTTSRSGTVSVGPQGQIVTVNQPAANNTNPTATFSASPNPIAACGSQSTGTTTFTWNATGVSGVQLYVGTASGTPLYSGASSGSYTTSSITNGEVVILTDSSQNVLGQVTLYLNYACGATLVQAVVTDQTDFSNAICAVPNSKTTFDYTSAFSTLWFRMQNVPAGSAILAEFLDPNGNVQLNQTFTVNSAAQQYCNVSVAGVFYDYSDGFVPATLPGGWTARLSLNGNVLGTVPYYINAPLTYTWTFTANSDASDISQPPFNAATKTFSMSDSGIYTYFSANDSQAGDVNRLYYFRWDATNQVWVSVTETDYDPLDSGGTWYFSDDLAIAGNTAVTQYPGYFAVLATVQQQGGVETPTFQEIVSVTAPAQLQTGVASLNFTAAIGSAAPAAQTIPVTSAPSGAAVTATVTNGSPWLSAQLSGAVTPANLIVSVTPGVLALGAYHDSITLTTPGSSVTIPVTFSITTLGPVLTSVSPTSAAALSGPVSLQANGQNFTSDARVHWNGPGGNSADLSTQFQSSVLLSATLPASYLTSPGTAQVSVGNSTGASNVVTFLITPPAPTISSVSPNSITAGSSAITISITGTNFVAGALVTWTAQGSSTSNNLQTQVTSATQVNATIPASYLSSVGTASISVSNAGVSSNTVNFQIVAPSASPNINHLSPASVAYGIGPFNLIIAGTNFGTGSKAFWNGTALVTVFVSPTELIAGIPGSLVQNSFGAGSAAITVVNGSQTSKGVSLGIYLVSGAFSSQTMTASGPPNDGTCGNPTPSASFVKANTLIYNYFVANITTGDTLTTEWVGPDGSILTGESWTNVNGNYCYYSPLEIDGTPANRLGQWQARVSDNGTMVFWLPFTIN